MVVYGLPCDNFDSQCETRDDAYGADLKTLSARCTRCSTSRWVCRFVLFVVTNCACTSSHRLSHDVAMLLLQHGMLHAVVESSL
jgi:sterol desaturase/sphingolipid hydroxylase (fatty acid hydroxylase superfamily)